METQPLPSRLAPAVLRLGVMGLTQRERRLLEGLLSERDTRNRTLRISLADDHEFQQADVLLVDAHDPAAFSWARQQNWLVGKPVIWLDGTFAAPGHTIARRPFQWTALPALLKRAIDNLRHAATPQAALAPPQRRPHLLLVDDSSTARTRIRGLLAQRGCDASEAGSVDECMALVACGHYDMVFMDVLMPGADGYEGCRRVKAATRAAGGIPVVILTSRSSPFDRIRGKMAGCDAYLTKPVDARRLDQVLARHAPGSHAATPRQAGGTSRPAPLTADDAMPNAI